MTPEEEHQATPEQIRAYVDQFADSIYVRVRLPAIDFQPGEGFAWRNLTVKELRAVNAEEAERVVSRLCERAALPHRVLVV